MLPPDSVYYFKSNSPVYSLNFQNQRLYCGKAGKIQLYDLETLRANYDIKIGSTNPVIGIVSNNKNMDILCQERTGILKVFELTNKSGYCMKWEHKTDYSGFAKFDCCFNKGIIVVPKNSMEISVIDYNNLKEIQILKPPETTLHQVTSLKLITMESDNLYLLAGYESGHAILFDLKTFSVISELEYDFPVTSLDYDLCTNRGILSGIGATKIYIFSIDETKMQLYKRDDCGIDMITKDSKKQKDEAGITCSKIRPDKKCLCVGDCDGIINIYSWKSLRKLAGLKEHRGEISDIAFSDEIINYFKSPIMAASGVDGCISLWNVYY